MPLRIAGILRPSGWTRDRDPDGTNAMDEGMRRALIQRAIVFSPETEEVTSGEMCRVDRSASTFTLEPDDPEAPAIQVDIANEKELIVEPLETKANVRWKNIASVCSALREIADDKKKWPKPHPSADDNVDVASVAAFQRTHVEVLANENDVEYAFDNPTELRGAPERRLVRLTARAIVIGEADDSTATAMMDEIVANIEAADEGDPDANKNKKKTKTKRKKKTAKPQRSKSRHRTGRSVGGYFIGTTGACAVFIATQMIIAGHAVIPLAVDVAACGFALIIGGTSAWALQRRPMFVKRDKAVDALSAAAGAGNPLVWMWCAAMALFMMVVIADAMYNRAEPLENQPNLSLVSGLTTALLAVGTLAVLLFQKQLVQNEQLLRRLLTATPLQRTGAIDSMWGSIEGVVRDPTPVHTEGEASALAHVIDEKIEPGSNPNILTERILSVGTFFLDEEHPAFAGPDSHMIRGGEFEIHPKDAVWTSVVRLRTPIVNDRRVHAQVIPIGGSVLAAGQGSRAGKKSRKGDLRSVGNESLIIFASDRGTRARTEADALVNVRKTALWIIVFAFAGDIAFLAYVEPQLPPIQMGTHHSTTD